MPLIKRTYTLPQETVELFERAIAPPQRSVVLAALLRDWLETQRREQLRREIVAGCQEMAEVYLEIEHDFHALEEEVEHAITAPAKTWRNRARTPRSQRRIGTSR